MDWYSAVNYVFASTLQILLLRFVPTFQEDRKLHHLSHGPLICSCSLWKKSLPKNSHYFRSLHTKLQLSWGQASTLLKPFSACHPPAGTSSSSTESRASTSGGKAFLLYFVRRSSWASTSMSPVWGDNKTTQRKFRGSLFGTATKNFVLSKHQETYSILLSLGVVSQDRGPAFPRDTVYFGTVYVSVTYTNRASTIALLKYLIFKHV